MKTNRIRKGITPSLAIALALIGSGPCIAAGSEKSAPTAADVRAEMAEAADTLEDYTAEQRDQAVREMREALRAIDARIETLETRLENLGAQMSAEAKQATRDALAALRTQRRKVAEWYGAMRHSSESAWQHIRHGFADAYRSLLDALVKAEDEF